MPETERWTVGRLLEWTTDYLKGHDVESPRLDAEVLLAAAIGCGRIDLYTRFAEEPAEDARTTFREFVKKRAEGAPVAHLVGHREFYSLRFTVSPDVLVPRPETEHLVVALLDLAKERTGDESIAIADIGTGSGIVAVCAAKHLANARITAVDLSPAALEIAKTNAVAHEVVEQIDFVESDLLAAIPLEQQFDFVVSNPPYVADGEDLPTDVRDHEPHIALFGGPNGTEVIERLIDQAAQRVRPDGYLLMEIGPNVCDSVEQMLDADDRFVRGETIADLARLPRVVQAKRN